MLGCGIVEWSDFIEWCDDNFVKIPFIIVPSLAILHRTDNLVDSIFNRFWKETDPDDIAAMLNMEESPETINDVIEWFEEENCWLGFLVCAEVGEREYHSKRSGDWNVSGYNSRWHYIEQHIDNAISRIKEDAEEIWYANRASFTDEDD